MITKEEVETYWTLHAKMVENNQFDNPTYKFCDRCLKLFPIPKTSAGDDHWRWIKPSKKHKAGSWRCRMKDKDARTRQYYGTGSRSTLDGYLVRKYEVLTNRCNNPNYQDAHIYRGKLNMSKEEFIEWGKKTLSEFQEKYNLDKLSGERIQLDRIDSSRGYEIGNIQWLLPATHIAKTGMENAVPVNQLDMDGNLVKRWDRMIETESAGFVICNVSHCCTGRQQTHKGFRWEYAEK